MKLTSRRPHHPLLPVAFFISSIGLSSASQAGNEVYVGKVSRQNRSMQDIDHSSFDQLLRKYVNEDGRVNYRGWKQNQADIAVLDQYLAELSTAGKKVAASNPARLAFWINAYNAVTIRGILREFPTTSIRNHTARLWGYNIWKHLQLYVGGEPVSLDQMEHEILRKMNEPRIHFAIVCASIGCPRLLNEAYQGAKIEDQLERNAKDFFARRQNFRYDGLRKKVYLSSILDWFGEDFGANQAVQLRTITRWLPTEADRLALAPESYTVQYLKYDWNLNQQ